MAKIREAGNGFGGRRQGRNFWSSFPRMNCSCRAVFQPEFLLEAEMKRGGQEGDRKRCGDVKIRRQRT